MRIVSVLQKTGKALLALKRMARGSKSDGTHSPNSVDGKTHTGIFATVVFRKLSFAIYFQFGYWHENDLTCNYLRMNRLSSWCPCISEQALGKEAEQAVASLEKRLWSEPRFHQALRDLTESRGATVNLACTIHGTVQCVSDVIN